MEKIPETIEELIEFGKNDHCRVAICNPGDIMFLKCGDYHGVITVYPEGNVFISFY